jgi:hypothetical protein
MAGVTYALVVAIENYNQPKHFPSFDNCKYAFG